MLDLWTLPGVEYVFESKRMKVESPSEKAQHVDVVEPIDVDPGDAIIIEMFEKFVAVGNLAFLEMCSIIFNQGDDRRMPLDVGAKCECARRFARNGMTNLEHIAF